MTHCNDCGKSIAEGYRYCYECLNKRNQNPKTGKNTGKKEELQSKEGIDLTKEINLPLWSLLLLITLGIIFGAWLF